MGILAFIEDEDVIEKIFKHLGHSFSGIFNSPQSEFLSFSSRPTGSFR